MYEPEITVLRPRTVPKPTSGRTIQNSEPSRASEAAERRSRVVTRTRSRFRLSSISVTSPTGTPR